MFERKWLLRLMASILSIAASTVAFAVPPRPQDSGSAAQVLMRERQYSAALLHGDVRLLAGVLADTFVDTSASGVLHDKQQLLALIARQPPPASILETQRRIQVYGDTAVVTVRFEVHGSDRGKPYKFSGRATDVWIHRSGKWLCVAAHSSAIG